MFSTPVVTPIATPNPDDGNDGQEAPYTPPWLSSRLRMGSDDSQNSQQQPRKVQKGQTVILLDWDDTILPTSRLLQHGPRVGRRRECSLLLQKAVPYAKFLLEACIRSGTTYIVTNAEAGWVEESAALWLPELVPLLARVRIISAREHYEALFPEDMMQWKISVFRAIRQRLSSASDAPPISSVVSLGDSEYEMEAARVMTEECEDAPLLKTLKFQPRPTLVEHLKQMQKAAESFDRIARSSKNLTVVLQRSRSDSGTSDN